MKIKSNLKWYFIKTIIVILAVLTLMITGCSYNIRMDPNIEPSANIANAINLRVGIFIPEETKRFKISDTVHTFYKYTFYVGEALESLIIKASKRVFTHVEVLESYPTQQMIKQRNLDLAVIAKAISGKTALNYSQGFFQTTAEGSTALSAQLTFYDEQMLQLTLVIGSGMGIGSEGWGLSTGQKEYSVSVESALRNLADDLIHQMNGNYDIRKKAEHQK